MPPPSATLSRLSRIQAIWPRERPSIALASTPPRTASGCASVALPVASRGAVTCALRRARPLGSLVSLRCLVPAPCPTHRCVAGARTRRRDSRPRGSTRERDPALLPPNRDRAVIDGDHARRVIKASLRYG